MNRSARGLSEKRFKRSNGVDTALYKKNYATGQAIPAGLHVQLDMQTGTRRAKLMDKVGPTQALPADDITPSMYFTKSVLHSSIIAVHSCSDGENID